MQPTIKFGIALPLENPYILKRIKDKSHYDHNYYELPFYGDWIGYGKDNNNILFEVYHENENCYTYSFGRFENDNYITAIDWTTDEDILDGIKIEDI